MTIPDLQSDSGVYAIICTITGKRYVGSSKRLYKRLTGHRRSLRKGRHHSAHLQRAWNLYGEEAFVVEILEYCEQEALLDREQGYLDLLRTYDHSCGYNMVPTALTSGRTCTQSEDAVANLRAYLSTHREERIQAAIEGQGRTYRLRAPDGAIVEGRGVNELARKHGLCQGAVLEVLDGRKQTTKGWSLPETDLSPYRFVDPSGEVHTVPRLGLHPFCKERSLGYKAMREVWLKRRVQYKGWRHPDVPVEPVRPRRHTDETKAKLRAHLAATSEQRIASRIEKQGRTFRIQSPEGHILEVRGVRAFARQHGLCYANLSSVLRGRVKWVGAWKLPETDGQPYAVRDPDGVVHIIARSHLNPFCEERGLSYVGVRKVAVGKQDHHRGWVRAEWPVPKEDLPCQVH